MKKRPNERLELMVSVALGEREQEELGKLTPREATRLQQLRSLVSDLKGPLYAAPESVLKAAKALFEVEEPVLMRLVSSSLTAEGARGAAPESVRDVLEGDDDRANAVMIHAIFEVEDKTARSMYVRIADGWRVIGQAPGPGWHAMSADSDAVCDSEGRFELIVLESKIPEIVLTKNGRRLILPAPTMEQ